METTRYGVERDFGKACPGMGQDVDNTRVRASRKREKTLASDICQQEPFVDEPWIGRPIEPVLGALIVPRKTLLEWRHARNFGAEVEHPVKKGLSGSRVDDLSAAVGQRFHTGNILGRQQLAV